MISAASMLPRPIAKRIVAGGQHHIDEPDIFDQHHAAGRVADQESIAMIFVPTTDREDLAGVAGSPSHLVGIMAKSWDVMSLQ